MDNSVYEYKTRRKARLDKRIIEAFKARRDARLKGRMDADEEETNNKNASGGHGNTKIPFGLCQREGIQIDPKWSPSDAWDALAGKGYSAGEVYKELKATGKTPKKAKKEKTKLAESHFPADLLGKTYKRNTLEFAEYINEHCDDPDISEFLSLATAPGAKQFPKMKVKRSMDGEGCFVRPNWSYDGTPSEYELVVPQLSKAKKPEQKAQAVRSFAHEYTHFLDDMARDKDNKSPKYSGTNEELKKAIDNNKWDEYGEEVDRVFKQYDVGYKKIVSDYRVKSRELPLKIAGEMFGERPAWLTETGSKIYNTEYWSDYENVEKFEKAVKAAKKEMAEDFARSRRSFMDGATCLEGIYDSISGGRMRAAGKVHYGHSLAYYKDKPHNRSVELLADYVALRATKPEYADIFRRDKPEIASALDNVLAEMVKRLRDAR